MVPISVERVVAGKVYSVEGWLEYVGKDHLDHRLERKPGSPQASVARIFLLTMCLGLSVMAPRHAEMFEATVLLQQGVSS